MPRIVGELGAVNARSELGEKVIKGKPYILLPRNLSFGARK